MLPIYKIVVSDDVEGMDFMGLVEHPAHSKTFIAFDKDQKAPKKSYFFNDDEQIIMGVAIATDVPIYRKDPDGYEYNVYFDKEQTRKIGQKMLSQMHLHNVNLQHDEQDVVSNIQLDTIFYVDKARGVAVPDVFKGQHLKDGSMIISYKVHGKDNWNQIKSDAQEGKINGFSIEGWFDKLEVNIKKKEKQSTMKKTKSLYELMFGKKAKHEEENEEKEFGEAETTDGVIIKWEGELEIGTAVFIMVEGEDDLQAPEGSLTVMNEDGTSMVLVIDASGIVSDIETIEEVEEVAAEEVAEVMKKLRTDLKADFDKQFKAQSTKFESIVKENKDLKEENKTQGANLEKLVLELDSRTEDRKETTVLEENEDVKKAYRELVKEKK